MKLKTYKFDETVKDFRETFPPVLPRSLNCPYCKINIYVDDDTKMFSRMSGDSYLMLELKCPHCGKTHYRLLWLAHFSFPTIESYQCLAAHIMYPIDKRELEVYTGTPVEKILHKYDCLWHNYYRQVFIKNYTLHYSYKKNFPKDKLYTTLTQISSNELSPTAKQVCEMSYADYPIEAFLISLDMIEE